MLIEDLITEVEDLINKLTNKQVVNLWNKVFPEEELQYEKEDFNEEAIDELRYMILGDLEIMELSSLIEIHNNMAEEEISIEDIMSNCFNDEDEEEEY